jgi:hypothetical protein
VKLSDYILNKYETSAVALSSDDMEEWIIEWYKTEFNKAPPMWLTRGNDVKI